MDGAVDPPRLRMPSRVLVSGCLWAQPGAAAAAPRLSLSGAQERVGQPNPVGVLATQPPGFGGVLGWRVGAVVQPEGSHRRGELRPLDGWSLTWVVKGMAATLSGSGDDRIQCGARKGCSGRPAHSKRRCVGSSMSSASVSAGAAQSRCRSR